MLLKRLPGLVIKYKWISFLVIFTVYLLISALHFGYVCTDLEPWNYIKTLCSDFGEKKLHGSLCPLICSAKTGVESVSCIRSRRIGGNRGRSSIFSAMLRGGDGTRVMFKSFNLESSAEQNMVDWAQSVNELSNNVRLNRTDPLLRDNVYLLTKFYEDKEIFPRLIGNCGDFYITEYVHPALDGYLIEDSGSLKAWSQRIHLAVELLRFVEQIDQENLLMCHVNPSKFGLTANGKVKLIDMELVLPRVMVNSLVSGGKSCSSDSECIFYDCKSTCNSQTSKCESTVINSNLQIICEKVLLGWSLPGRLLVPGLLMSVHIPMTVASLLRQCAHHIHSQEIAGNIAIRLAETLAEIDISLEQYRSN